MQAGLGKFRGEISEPFVRNIVPDNHWPIAYKRAYILPIAKNILLSQGQGGMDPRTKSEAAGWPLPLLPRTSDIHPAQ